MDNPKVIDEWKQSNNRIYRLVYTGVKFELQTRWHTDDQWEVVKSLRPLGERMEEIKGAYNSKT